MVSDIKKTYIKNEIYVNEHDRGIFYFSSKPSLTKGIHDIGYNHYISYNPSNPKYHELLKYPDTHGWGEYTRLATKEEKEWYNFCFLKGEIITKKDFRKMKNKKYELW